MFNKNQTHFLKCALLICLTVGTVAQARSTLLGELVPNIQTEYYEIKPAGNQYRLRITHPDGSQREELVELRAAETPGSETESELFVQGTLDNQFPDNGGHLVVTYEAGRNGYAAKVKYQGRPTLPPVPTRPTLPPLPPFPSRTTLPPLPPFPTRPTLAPLPPFPTRPTVPPPTVPIGPLAISANALKSAAG